MYIVNSLNGLQFNDNCTVHEQIQSIPTINLDAPVNDWNTFLTLNLDATR